MKKDIVKCSEFIGMLKREVRLLKNEGKDSAKTEKLIGMLEANLEERGDFEFDLNKMLTHFGV